MKKYVVLCLVFVFLIGALSNVYSRGEITLKSLTANKYSIKLGHSVTFRWSSDDAYWYEYRYEKNGVAIYRGRCVTDTSLTKRFDDEGEYKFFVKAGNKPKSNWSLEKSVTIKVSDELKAEVTSIYANPGEAELNKKIKFTWNADNADLYSYCFQLEGKSKSSWSSWSRNKEIEKSFNESGIHKIYVKCRKGDGKESAVKSKSFKIVHRLASMVSVKASSVKSVKGKKISFTWNGDKNAVEYNYRFNFNGRKKSGSSSWYTKKTYSRTFHEVGKWAIVVKCRNKQGKESKDKKASFEITEKHGPSKNITITNLKSSTNKIAQNKEIKFIWSGSKTAINYSYRFEKNGKKVPGKTTWTSKKSIKKSFKDSGKYKIYVKCRDKRKNESKEKLVSFEVTKGKDKPKSKPSKVPTMSSVKASPNKTAQRKEIKFSWSGSKTSDRYSYRFEKNGKKVTGKTTWTSKKSIKKSFKDTGKYKIYVKCRDKKKKESKEKFTSFEVTNEEEIKIDKKKNKKKKKKKDVRKDKPLMKSVKASPTKAKIKSEIAFTWEGNKEARMYVYRFEKNGNQIGKPVATNVKKTKKTFDKSGKYKIFVKCRTNSSGGKKREESKEKSASFEITPSKPAKMLTLKANPTETKVKKEINFTWTGSKEAKMYVFRFEKAGKKYGKPVTTNVGRTKKTFDKPGKYKIFVCARNEERKKSKEKSVSFKITTDKPKPAKYPVMESVKANPTKAVVKSKIEFTWKGNKKAKMYVFRFEKNGKRYEKPVMVKVTSIKKKFSKPGKYKIFVKCHDNNRKERNRKESKEKSASFEIEKIQPKGPLMVSVKASPTKTNVRSEVEFTWAGTKEANMYIYRFERNGNQIGKPITTNVKKKSRSFDRSGKHKIFVKCRDKDMNESKEKSASFGINASKPAKMLTVKAEPTKSKIKKEISFTWTGNKESKMYVYRFERAGKKIGKPVTTNVGRTKKSFDKSGKYKIFVKARNEERKESKEKSASFEITPSKSAKMLTLKANPTETKVKKEINFTWTGNKEAKMYTFRFERAGKKYGKPITTNVGRTKKSFEKLGKYKIFVKARNEERKYSKEKSASFRITSDKPKPKPAKGPMMESVKANPTRAKVKSKIEFTWKGNKEAKMYVFRFEKNGKRYERSVTAKVTKIKKKFNKSGKYKIFVKCHDNNRKERNRKESKEKSASFEITRK